MLALAEGLRPTEIADRLAVRLPTVSESVRTLVERGLVEKDRARTSASGSSRDSAKSLGLLKISAGRNRERLFETIGAGQ